ncbi:MAG: hypothetical protein A2878_00195 [Candidatus Moranbacteria bacterium RIFCSPHIGHO2_01_FULL_54_31]|nr:MAG: hypothetical protein A2878_00195 [Candidatus Moranbacteria bacterium RIFCSPHIGHO2_01_FULL_54_31]
MKKYSTHFWVAFVIGAVIFLSGWFVFWEVKHQGFESLKRLLGAVPVKQEVRTDLETVMSLADALLHTDGEERAYLILFQNNLELRPGGGFIGSFGILKVRDGNVADFAVHDTGNFDGRIPSTVEPPYPMRETLKIDSWKLRDSNYSPDFAENAKRAEDFYHMGNGTEQFDGVVAVTANVLTSFLKVTGPVEIAGFPGVYSADNAILDLEYQVEQGYLKQDIEFGERKSVMGMLGLEILHRVKALPLAKQYELFQTVLADLHQKDIQLRFKDELLQEQVAASGWDGAMDSAWKNDYLFLVDANLNSFKSDYFVKRSYAYTVDLSQAVPQATLAVTYQHTAEKRDWFAKDYQTFLRVYVPAGSYLNRVTGAAKDPVYGEFLNKKYFGALVQVPLAMEKTVTFEYALPENLERQWYDLKIQKQPGLSDVPVTVTIIRQDGSREEKHFVLDRDTVLGDLQ